MASQSIGSNYGNDLQQVSLFVAGGSKLTFDVCIAKDGSLDRSWVPILLAGSKHNAVPFNCFREDVVGRAFRLYLDESERNSTPMDAIRVLTGSTKDEVDTMINGRLCNQIPHASTA